MENPSPEKRIAFYVSVPCLPNDHGLIAPLASTPIKTDRKNIVETISISPVRPVILERSDENDSCYFTKTVVKVSIIIQA